MFLQQMNHRGEVKIVSEVAAITLANIERVMQKRVDKYSAEGHRVEAVTIFNDVAYLVIYGANDPLRVQGLERFSVDGKEDDFAVEVTAGAWTGEPTIGPMSLADALKSAREYIENGQVARILDSSRRFHIWGDSATEKWF